MPSVTARNGESIDKLLRRFCRQVMKAGVMSELRSRRHYMKPSDQRRAKSEKAERRRAKSAKRAQQKAATTKPPVRSPY